MIGLIVGTNRPGSSTYQVARQVESIYQALGVSVSLLDLARLPAACFAPEAYAVKPPGFKEFSETVLASHGLVVVTPEYNGGAPGVLKYFIDLLKFPESFDRRPVCFIGLSASAWGGLRPVEQLQQIFGFRNAFLYPERVFLPRIHELLDNTGRLADPEILRRLRVQAVGFVDFVERLRGVRLTKKE